MRMRIAVSHDLTLVFKNLHVPNGGNRTERFIFFLPDADNIFDFLPAHFRHCQIMGTGIVHHTANAAFAFGNQEVIDIVRFERRCLEQCGEIVRKNKCAFIIGINVPMSASVAGAKVAFRFVGIPLFCRQWRDIALPWTRGSMRRNQHPVSVQYVLPAVRMSSRFKCFHRFLFLQLQFPVRYVCNKFSVHDRMQSYTGRKQSPKSRLLMPARSD